MSPHVSDLRPEIDAAFFGSARLLSAQRCFSSRDELLTAYAYVRQQRFDLRQANSETCSICSAGAPQFSISIQWSARLSRRRGKWGSLLNMLHLLVPLPFVPLAFVVHCILRTASEERIGFVSRHSLCRSCRRRLQLRQFLHAALSVLAGFLGVVSGSAAVILAAILLCAATGTWGFVWRETRDLVSPFLLALTLCYAVKAISPGISRRVLFPRAIQQAAKAPFRHEAYDLCGLNTVASVAQVVK